MAPPDDNRVRPVVRVAAGTLAAVFALGVLGLVVMLFDQVLALVRGEAVAWWLLVPAPLVIAGFYKFGSYFFAAAWTGENPRWFHDDERESNEPGAV
jgi:hypothetical protein